MRSHVILTFAAVQILMSCTPGAHRVGSKKIVQTARISPAHFSTKLSGYVLNEATGHPVAHAWVFLSATELSTETDEDGFFAFSDVPLGAFTLVASSPELATITEKIQVRDTVAQVLTLEGRLNESTPDQSSYDPDERIKALEQEIRRLKRSIAVNRRAELQQRGEVLFSKELQLFEKFIIGNPSKCKLLNPEALQFKTDISGGSWVTFSSSRPLVIENRVLGYLVRILLERANLSKNKGWYTINVRGLSSFEKLTPVDQKQADRWRENRQKAYRGSFRHFLTALAAGRVDQEGFTVFVPSGHNVSSSSPNLPGYSFNSTPDFMPIDNLYSIISRTEKPFDLELNFSDILKVMYLNERVPSDYHVYRGMESSDQTSMVMLQNGSVHFTPQGHLLGLEDVVATGYWSIERISDMLPSTYWPD